MSLEPHKTCALKDLAKSALGTGDSTIQHLSVLKSLLGILLQKFNCQNEIVHIRGFPANCIQKLLNDKINTDQSETINSFQGHMEFLIKMERKAQEIDLKLEEHFEQIRNCHRTKRFAAQKWDFYASPAEDLCTLYMKHNKAFCLLARNPVFNKELRSRVVPQVTERFKLFESRIENMRSKISEITQVAKKNRAKLSCVQFAINDIENIRSAMNVYAINFRETMLETQEMLNCKSNRVTLPALRKYLEARFVNIRRQLRVLETVSKKCPPTKPLKIKDKNTCLSCSRHQDFKFHKKFVTLKSIDECKRCMCRNLFQSPTIVEKMDRMKLLASVPPAATKRYSEKKFFGISTD